MQTRGYVLPVEFAVYEEDSEMLVLAAKCWHLEFGERRQFGKFPNECGESRSWISDGTHKKNESRVHRVGGGDYSSD